MRPITSTRHTSGQRSTGSGRPSDLTGLAGARLLAAEPDERLVALARAGDAAAFDAIVERYRAPLLRYCLGFLPPAAAEDALQQTFINAYAALSRDDGRTPLALKPWLYRVAHNAALNVARDPGAGMLELPAELDGVERPDEVAVRRERFARVVGALRALPPKQRQVIVRHALEGESHERIAEDFGMSAGAIRQLAHRARRTVREAAAALVPMPILRLLPFAESAPAVGGGGAAAVKVAVTIAVVAAGGGAAVEATRDHPGRVSVPQVAVADAAAPRHRAQRPSPVRAVVPAPTPAATTAPARVRTAAPAVRRDDSSASGSSRDDSPGPGPSHDDSSGSSGSSGGPGPSSSGGGSSGSGSSGSGSSGSGSFGSGSSGSGPGPSSSSSGSDTSGSGSSGSGSSGSSGGGPGPSPSPSPTPEPIATVDADSSGKGSSGRADGVDDHSGPG
jgi:RNA polymerase sigma factor (sigma-70 family)